jgi:hydrogenase nickel incorporation protein HypB
MCRDCGCDQAGKEHEHLVDGQIVRHTHFQGRWAGVVQASEEHEHLVDGQIVRHSHLLDWLGGQTLTKITVEQSVLAKNDRIAKENRLWFKKNGIRVLNLISSPGSGKTLLLEQTVKRLRNSLKLTILNGDQEHDFDAARLKSAGADVLQLNTMSSCHLDASMISRELGLFVSPEPQLLVIENVGNLVCPAAFDLGETMKVALLSITEGEDKPSKYPLLFHEAGLIVLTKMDLLPHLDWDLELCKEHIRRVNASAPIICLSAKTGDGLESWIQFLRGDEIEQSA